MRKANDTAIVKVTSENVFRSELLSINARCCWLLIFIMCATAMRMVNGFAGGLVRGLGNFDVFGQIYVFCWL